MTHRYRLGEALTWGPKEIATWRAFVAEQERVRMEHREKLVTALTLAGEWLAEGRSPERVAARLLPMLEKAV